MLLSRSHHIIVIHSSGTVFLVLQEVIDLVVLDLVFWSVA